MSLVAATSVPFAFGDSLHQGSLDTPGYVAQIQAHNSQEINDILTRLDSLLASQTSFPSSQPLALVLHGDEAAIFLKKNYSENKDLVDLAARLDAFHALDVQICEAWMRDESVSPDQIPAFVDTVPYGPDRESALIEQGYIYF